jgi:hypothetical protein
MTTDRFDKVLALIRRLEAARIPYQMAAYREDAISVVVRGPGRYWEIDFLDNGDVDVECFVSNGHIDDESGLEDLFSHFSEEPASQDAAAGT